MSRLGMGYGLGQSPADQAAQIRAAADALEKQALAERSRLNAVGAGIIRIGDDSVTHLNPHAPNFQALKTDGVRVTTMLRDARIMRAEASRVDAQAKALADQRARQKSGEAWVSPGSSATSGILDSFYSRRGSASAAAPSKSPKPATKDEPYVYRGPTYQPGRILSAMPPPRQSSLDPIPLPIRLRRPSVVYAPGPSYAKVALIVGAVVAAGAAAYWIIK